MNTKQSKDAKIVQMNPQPKSKSKALESILHTLEFIEKEISGHLNCE